MINWHTIKFNIITEPNLLSKGLCVAMFEHHGAPIKSIEFER